MKNILLAFIPIFVAVDAIGVLPLFISLTEDLSKKDRVRIVGQSIVTALCLAITFLFLGKAIFKFLSITIGDFMIAGGCLLFCLAIMDIVSPAEKRRWGGGELGAVPLGTPLIVGPAVLTTSLIMVDAYGVVPALISVFSNIILAGIVFLFSEALIKILGEAGTKAVSKVMALLLAAIAVMLIRKGIFFVLANPS